MILDAFMPSSLSCRTRRRQAGVKYVEAEDLLLRIEAIRTGLPLQSRIADVSRTSSGAATKSWK
jgi:hypothetical protein